MAPLYVLVTGSTHGIGLATVQALAASGHHVCVHGRSEARCRAVLERLCAQRPVGQLSYIRGDFGALTEVAALAPAYARVAPRLDVLVNNAGCANLTRQVSRDGYETTFAVNHLAPFLLTQRLLPMLLAAGSSATPARIVNVASSAHRQQAIDFDDLMSTRDYQPMRAYGRSKLANILFTRTLAARLAGRGVTVNALHPGVVRTHIGQNNLVTRAIGAIVMAIRGIAPEEGAKTSVFLSTSEDARAVTGEYFVQCRIAPLSTAPEAVTAEIGERLWQDSDALIAKVCSASA